MAFKDKNLRDAKLDELKTKLEQYVEKRREELRMEREFLDMVLKNQGFNSVGRTTANSDKLKALATVKQLIPINTIK